MRNAGIHVFRPKGDKSQLFIEPKRMGLRSKHRPADPGLSAQMLQKGADQRRADPRAPRLAQHTDPPDLARVALDEDTRTAHRTPFKLRQHMMRLAVAPVAFLGFGHILFVDEDRGAQRQTGPEIRWWADLEHHAK